MFPYHYSYDLSSLEHVFCNFNCHDGGKRKKA